MPELLSSPVLLFMLIGAVGGLLSLFKPARRTRRRKAGPRVRPEPLPAQHARAAPEPVDPVAQLGQVAWRTKALMNASEFRTFRQLEQLVAEARSGQRLFSQVSIGEILRVDPGSSDRSTCTSAFNRVNAKRVDYLIIDRAGLPLVAIEYQGSGHYQSNAEMRDRIKREAFRLAGVPFVEVPRQGLSGQQLADLRRLLGLQDIVAAE